MRNLLVLVSLAATALVFTGCDSGRAAMAPKEANVLGAVTYQAESYAPTSPASFTIRTDELYAREDFSGDKVTLLWGLITIKDY